MTVTATRTYPTTRAYRTRVARISPLSEHFVRFTLTGEDLVHFGTGGLDQRIKLMIPRPDGTLPEIGLFADPAPAVMEWYQRWRALPDEERNPMRTYTVRAVRPHAREIDVDFVLHGTEGPASAWASTAAVGDEIVVIGPDERSETGGRGRSGGIEFDPGEATTLLLAGDETAAPAICSILESLGERHSGHVYLEVPTAADVLPVMTLASVQVHWLPRDGRPHGEALTEALHAWGREHGAEVADRGRLADPQGPDGGAPGPAEAEDGRLWEVPDEGPRGRWYAWLAGEAGTITGIRRHLVKDLGIDRTCVSFMGYWKRGRAEGC
ncbi:siderophore-interacting protein [Citricoccus sp. SGAir0253]|uniref:siderophore-interacting protein n=1 Tax=Citricoccus sp. SGAir0253 TaxID=2567881 RepID=UPI0010CCFD83|nr:siderophore-interacting protein [Citricoccus sp. SGAir0253]QCU77518.1 siderophore-interacting protein [Citricoccus sp. SGAir0253]